jgi:hypothetical protein
MVTGPITDFSVGNFYKKKNTNGDDDDGGGKRIKFKNQK